MEHDIISWITYVTYGQRNHSSGGGDRVKPNMNSSAGNLLNIINEEIQRQLNGGRRKRKPKEHVLGTIADNYINDGSRPFVIVDGDPIPIGPFNYLGSYQPVAGERVLLAKSGRKYVILGKII